jgi:hypothetical protein
VRVGRQFERAFGAAGGKAEDNQQGGKSEHGGALAKGMKW